MPNSYVAKATAGALKLQRQFDPGPHNRFRPPVGGGGTRAGLPGPSTRGRTSTTWSKRSQRSMRYEYGALPWEMLGRRPVMITLTYPGDWDVWVEDARELHRHREALKSRWTRRFGAPIGVWVTEFQKRGAPHLHMYLALPDEVSEKEYVGLQKRTMERRRLERDVGRYAARGQVRAPKGDFSMWLRTAWWEIVGSESSKHHGRGVDIATAFFSDKAEAEANRIRVADYFWRESGKWAQKQPPEGFGGLKFYGRWGGKQGFKPVVTEAEVDERTGLELRRVLVRWQRQKMRDAARRGGWEYRKGAGGPRGRDGLTVFDVNGRDLLPSLLAWANDLASQKAAGPLVRGYVQGAGDAYRRAWSEFVYVEDEDAPSDLAPDDWPDDPWAMEQDEWARQEAELDHMLEAAAAREAAIDAQIEKAEHRRVRQQQRIAARARNRNQASCCESAGDAAAPVIGRHCVVGSLGVGRHRCPSCS